MKHYEKIIEVTSGDLDDLDHVNNVRYLEWVQDISKEHWEQLSNKDWDSRYIWVVKSHHITYHRPALLGETLRLTTFVPEAKGAISKRKVEMELESGAHRITDCLTEWVLLDSRTGRPVRMPVEMQTVFQ